MNFHDALLQGLAERGLDTSYVPENPDNVAFAKGAASSLGESAAIPDITATIAKLDEFGNAIVQSWADLTPQTRDIFAGVNTHPTEMELRSAAHEAEVTYDKLTERAVDVLFTAEYNLFPPATNKTVILANLHDAISLPAFSGLPVSKILPAMKSWPVKLDDVVSASVADLVAARIARFAPDKYRLPPTVDRALPFKIPAEAPAVVTVDRLLPFQIPTGPGTSTSPTPGAPDLGAPPMPGRLPSLPKTSPGTANGLFLGAAVLLGLLWVKRR